MSRKRTKVLLGCEIFLEQYSHSVKGKKIGLVTNPTGVNDSLESLIDIFFHHPEIDLVALFGPEHGIRGNVQAGRFVPSYTDEETGLPVFSLYGQSLKPDQLPSDLDESMRSFDTIEEGKFPESAMLDSLDVLVYDIQDIGTRIYTYVSTMAFCMRTCASKGIEFVVLDRPNPLNGKDMEGPIVDYPRFSYFVGLYPVPVRHGMTSGELAKFFNERFFTEKVDLTIIPMEGWKRNMWYDQTGLHWVAPSPNIPTLQTATVYPGQVFLEGTNISEGRGTTQPFELFGAPWIDGYALARNLSELDLPGAEFREAWFTPSFSKYVGQTCGGAQLHVVDRDSFRPFETALHIIKAVRDMYPEEFRLHTEYFDKIMGTDRIRESLEEGEEVENISAECSVELENFSTLRKAFLLY